MDNDSEKPKRGRPKNMARAMAMVKLYTEDGLTMQQIANRYRISKEAVRSCIHPVLENIGYSKPVDPKVRQFCVKVTEDQERMVDRVTKKSGKTKSDMVLDAIEHYETKLDSDKNQG